MGFLSPVGPGTMPTVFESITRAVVKEMDTSGEMIAVRSLGDADKFHCFYLVKKRRRFFGYQYDKTNLTLKDILESEVPFDMVVPEFQGQYEVVRDCPLLLYPSLNAPLLSTRSASQQRNREICMYTSIHLNLKCSRELHGEKGIGEVTVCFSWKLFLNSLFFLFFPFVNNSLLN